MSLSDLWTTKASVESMTISGSLRVEIRSNVPPLALALEIAGFGWYSWFVWTLWHRWSTVGWFERFFVVSTLVSGFAGLLYQISHSETIEFDPQNLTIRRGILGWAHTSRYPLEKCSELSWCVQDETKFGLECKVGWRKIRFAHNVSEAQAREILSSLQHDLPVVAQKIGQMPGTDREHITRLGLN